MTVDADTKKIPNKIPAWDNIETVLLDMDGTLYLGEHVFDGTIEFLKAIRQRGKDGYHCDRPGKQLRQH